MPRGTRHDETGILLENGLYPKLRLRGGGEWRLEITKRYNHLLGCRVRVIGVRAGFDLLEVQHIEAVGTAQAAEQRNVEHAKLKAFVSWLRRLFYE